MQLRSEAGHGVARSDLAPADGAATQTCFDLRGDACDDDVELASLAKGVMALGVVESLIWPEPEGWAKSMSSFCAVSGAWVLVTNTHHSELATQNDLSQRK
jgi:hypothetical protein